MILLEDSPSSTNIAFAGCFFTHIFLPFQRAPLITLQCRHWSTSTPMRWSWPLATHGLLRPSWRKPLASASSRSSWPSVRPSARWGMGWLFHIVPTFLLKSCVCNQDEHYGNSSAAERLETACYPIPASLSWKAVFRFHHLVFLQFRQELSADIFIVALQKLSQEPIGLSLF